MASTSEVAAGAAAEPSALPPAAGTNASVGMTKDTAGGETAGGGGERTAGGVGGGGGGTGGGGGGTGDGDGDDDGSGGGGGGEQKVGHFAAQFARSGSRFPCF